MSGEGGGSVSEFDIATITKSIADWSAAKIRLEDAKTRLEDAKIKNLRLVSLQDHYETKKKELSSFYSENTRELDAKITFLNLTEEEIAEARKEMNNEYQNLKLEVDFLDREIKKLLKYDQFKYINENGNENENVENTWYKNWQIN